jgi:hypothetical protein
VEADNSEKVTWVLEPEIFSEESWRAMREAVLAQGHDLVVWNDEWWTSRRWPRLSSSKAVFHGSLGNAARIREELAWRPGAYCDASAFCCSAWYPRAEKWLLHRTWCLIAADALVADPGAVLERLGATGSLFVRPDSPLKPFGGRVLQASAIDLRALDHGIYYDDARLPVLAAPVRSVGREWRYVIVARRVVAGSAYEAGGRSTSPDDPAGAPWRFATQIAQDIEPPEPVYVMDICEAEGELRLLELNPFSGANLYCCKRSDVVEEVSRVALRGEQQPATAA